MNTGLRRKKNGKVGFKTVDIAEGKINRKWIDKERRRLWWLNLTSEQKEQYIKKQDKKKNIMRSIEFKLFNGGELHNCTNCIHSKTNNCTESGRNKDKVCKMFMNTNF